MQTTTSPQITTELHVNASDGNIRNWAIFFEGHQMMTVPEGQEARRDRIMKNMAANPDAAWEIIAETTDLLAQSYRNPQHGPADA